MPLMMMPTAAFQSTLPMKGATCKFSDLLPLIPVSIHAPNEGSDWTISMFPTMRQVSIHAPNEGSDVGIEHGDDIRVVSIHAPNEGSDFAPLRMPCGCTGFNPRSQ